MITQLHRTLTGTVSISDVPHDAAANSCHIVEQANQSGRRLRNLLLGNAVAWIVIVLVARAVFF